jgi:aspartate/methionine/tyrosine aminotransferase
MFSARVTADRRPNRLSAAVSARRVSGRRFIDLTLSNPTAAGIRYPENLLAPLAAAEGAQYAPEPFGLRAARDAVAADAARRGTRVATHPDRVVLTASTSEAYSLLFKLLCDPGDEVLIPVPSYPLFEHLSRLDAIRACEYHLEYHGRWMVDVHAVDAGWTARTRALLAVSPNNPTGSVLSDEEWAALAGRCAERHAAFIVDEVFADYPLTDIPVPAPGPSPALTFRLGGLSKSAGLPQVKLGWIVVDGPDALVNEALERLEIISDTYLSVSTPVQVAAAELIARGAGVRHAILQRIRTNDRALRALAASFPSVAVLPADAGWSAVLRIPSTRSEEDVVLHLLEHDDVLVHPGYFFDFPHEAFLVVSLLPPPEQFVEGARRVLERAHG